MVEQGKYADVNGIQTHYHEDGQGEPLLLIHGSGPGVSAWANWRLVFPILSEKLSFICTRYCRFWLYGSS